MEKILTEEAYILHRRRGSSLSKMGDEITVPANMNGKAKPMPLAIVGLSCRLPRGIHTPEAFWDFLTAAGSGRRGMPKERFDADAFYHPNPERAGTMNVKHGYFLDDDLRSFDAAFFNVAEEEAKAMVGAAMTQHVDTSLTGCRTHNN